MPYSNICDEFAELLDAYHDGELSELDHKRVAEHVSICQPCQGKLSKVASVAAQLSSLPPVQLSRDIVGSMEFNFDVDFEPAFDFGGGDDKHGGELLDAYHDGELSKEESIKLERHIASCSDCAQKLAQIERVVQNVRQIPKLLPAADIVDKLDFNCEPIIPLLDAFHDGELNAAEKKQVEEHLTLCTVCSSSLSSTVSLVAALKGLPVLQPSRDIVGEFSLPSEISATIPSASRDIDSSNKVVPIRRKSVWAGLSAAAAAAAVLIFAVNQKVLLPVDTVANNNTTQQMQAPAVVAEQATVSPAKNLNSDNGSNEVAVNAGSHDSGAVPATTANSGSHELIAEHQAHAPAPLLGEAASQPNSLPGEMPGENAAAVRTQVVVPVQLATAKVQDSGLNELASLETDGGVADALGIATDEDGLYDIKI